MRRILDSFDIRMQNAGVGQTGIFEEIPDNLIEDTLNKLHYIGSFGPLDPDEIADILNPPS